MTTKDDIKQIVEEVNIVQEEMHQICIVNANLSKRIASLESRLLNESTEGEVRFHLSVCRKALQDYMEACVDFRTQSGGYRILSNVSDHLEAAEKVLNRKALVMTKVTKASHTPGDWTVAKQNGDGLEEYSGLVGVVGPEQTNLLGKKFTLYVAQYIKPEDAKLIAAAPDLLEACQKMLEAFQYTGEPLVGVVYMAKENMAKTIAKATGDQ